MHKGGKFVVAFVLAAAVAGSPVNASAVEVPESYMTDISTLMSRYPGTRDQGLYNSCWAFSAVGLAEFDMITDDKLADKNVDYSELQLAYFTYNHVTDPLGGTYGDGFYLNDAYDYLSMGGNLEMASRTLMQWMGIRAESQMPYESASVTADYTAEDAFSNNEVHLQNVYTIDIYRDPDAVKQAVMEHGAVGIGCYSAVAAYEFSEYESAGMYKGAIVPTVYYNSEGHREPNHAVNIVGWDDNFPAESFRKMPEGNGAWLVRNSWNDKTGYHADGSSYYWLSYYDTSIEDWAWVYDFEPADNYDYNYQYDGCTTCFNARHFDAAANVFLAKARENELLRAVSVSLMNCEDVPYTVKIYTNLSSGSKPDSGYLAATVSGRTSHPGIYTIPLEKAVVLAKGTKYSVVVELSNREDAVDMEYSYTDPKGRYYTNAYISAGQSFAKESGTWEDVQEMGERFGTGNFCIKAYTDGAEGSAVAQVKTLGKKSADKKSVTLSWGRVAEADGYEIYRASARNGTYKKIATVKSGKKVSYKNSGLAKNKVYYYRVRAYKNQTGADGQTTVTVGKMSAVKAIRTLKK